MTIRYRDLLDEIKIHTTGLNETEVIREIRSAVIEVCREFVLLKKTDTIAWKSHEDTIAGRDDIYHLSHPGYSFNKLTSVYLEREDPTTILDTSHIRDLTIGVDETTFRIFGVREGLWTNVGGGVLGAGNYREAPDNIVVDWAFTPTEESDDFPMLVYRQHRLLIKYASLKNMGSFLSMNRVGATPQWGRDYDREARKLNQRRNVAVGPVTVEPMFGGSEDSYGTTGGGAPDTGGGY